MRRTLIIILVLSLAVPAAGTGVAQAEADTIEAAGIVHGGIYSNVFWAEPDLNALAEDTGKKVTFAGTFHAIDENDGIIPPNPFSNTREMLDQVWLAEATPFANVTINATAYSIASGSQDAKINEWASHVEQYLDKGDGRTLIIAPMQEMNGDWTPYGCDAGNFKVAYRNFVDIFRARGLDETKVRWAFAPNGWTSFGCGTLADYYPGDSYVDIIGISAYNFGLCVPPSATWSSVYVAVASVAEDLRATVTATKPYIVAQTGVPRPAGCGGDPDQWVRDLFSFAASDANVIGIVYFNFDKALEGETDWRVWDGAKATQGWRDGMASAGTVHQWPLSDWFQPGPLPFSVAAPPPPPPPPPPPAGSGPCPDAAICDTVAFIDAGGRWHRYGVVADGASVDSYFFGNPGDIAFKGDWDCDGVATPGLYRQTDGFVYLRNSNTQGVADVEFFFGDPGDIPLIGDFDGDGCDTVSIYRDSEAKVYIVNDLGEDGGGLGAADFSFFFGNPGDRPYVGDFDGDGIDTVGLYRQSTGFVYFRDSLNSGVADLEFFYGDPGDQILAADWDGDGDDTVAVYRPSDGNLYVNLDNAPGAADFTIYVGDYAAAVAAGID